MTHRIGDAGALRRKIQREMPHLRLITASRLQTERNKRALLALPWLRLDGVLDAPDWPLPIEAYTTPPYTGIKYWYYVVDTNTGALVSYVGNSKGGMKLECTGIRRAHPSRSFEMVMLEQTAEACQIISWLQVERLDSHPELSCVPEYSHY
jgi:hypothetical protein